MKGCYQKKSIGSDRENIALNGTKKIFLISFVVKKLLTFEKKFWKSSTTLPYFRSMQSSLWEKEKKQTRKKSFWFIGLGIATACIVWVLLDLSVKDVTHLTSTYLWILGLGGLGLFLGAMINLRKLN